jgi:hypothetical protein
VGKIKFTYRQKDLQRYVQRFEQHLHLKQQKVGGQEQAPNAKRSSSKNHRVRKTS